MVGLGILRDLPGQPDFIADIVPVDYVVNQILASIPFALTRRASLFITHCSSSNSHPMTWNTFFAAITRYQNQFPYENRAGHAALAIHPTQNAYRMNYKLKNKLPTNAVYYLTRVLGSKAYSK